MPRAVIFLLILVLVIGALLFFLSSHASEVPVQPIEIEVNTPADAR